MKYNLGDIVIVNTNTNRKNSSYVKGMIVATPDMTNWSVYILVVKETNKTPASLPVLSFYDESMHWYEDKDCKGFVYEPFDDNDISIVEPAGEEWEAFKRNHKSWYGGYKFRQCCVCKSKKPIDAMTKVGNRKYACNHCLFVQSYWTKNNESTGSGTKSGTRYGFELECIPKSDVDYKSALVNVLSKRKDVIPTQDGSLPMYGIEFKSPIMCNLKYARGLLSVVSENWDFSHQTCGQHINISIPELTAGMISHIASVRAYNNPFEVLKEYMMSHKNEVETVCGRYFTHYANNGSSYENHNNWINLSHDDRVEFRLSKVVSISQYIALAQMWTDILRICVKNYEDISSRTKPYHVANAIYGEKMIKTFQRYYKKISKMT